MSTNIGAILPKGKTQFLDSTGTPLAGGTVAFYIPGTTTQLATYEDQALSIANANPVILDANGEATIWGFGSYRQIVQDSGGNVLWDQVVSAPNVPAYGIDSGAVNALVVAIDGVSSLYTGLQLVIIPANTSTGAVTLALNGMGAISITLGSAPLLAGALVAGVAAQMLFDGTNLQLLNSQILSSSNNPGDLKAIAGNSPPAGWDLCYGKTYSRTANAPLFAAIGTEWGAGDGATTFVGPDFRGKALFGADAMGGVAANILTTASLGGTTGAIVGAVGGSELSQSHTHTATTTEVPHNHTPSYPTGVSVLASVGGIATYGLSSANGVVATGLEPASTGLTVTNATYGTGESQNLPPAAVINIIMCIG